MRILWIAIAVLAVCLFGYAMSYAQAYPLCHGSSLISRDGLTPATRAVLNRTEDHFHAKFQIIGACVHKAMSTDSSQTSYHSYGMAVDFLAPSKIKEAVVSYLYHDEKVLVMTYSDPHIHFNLGQGQQRIGEGYHATWASNGGYHESNYFSGYGRSGSVPRTGFAGAGPGSQNFH